MSTKTEVAGTAPSVAYVSLGDDPASATWLETHISQRDISYMYVTALVKRYPGIVSKSGRLFKRKSERCPNGERVWTDAQFEAMLATLEARHRRDMKSDDARLGTLKLDEEQETNLLAWAAEDGISVEDYRWCMRVHEWAEVKAEAEQEAKTAALEANREFPQQMKRLLDRLETDAAAAGRSVWEWVGRRQKIDADEANELGMTEAELLHAQAVAEVDTGAPTDRERKEAK